MAEGHEAITNELIAAAEELAGLRFTGSERELMREGLEENRASFEQLRKITLDNAVPPALRFDPRLPGMVFPTERRPLKLDPPAPFARPASLDELAFAPVTRLARLIQAREVSSVELTEMYLRRLERYDPVLKCVVTSTPDLALEQARRADAELAAGRYRGPLHGIPWGAKDLLATRGIPTTWGTPPFKNQVLDLDATVVERLDAAGAVLVAKLTLGELAWGDVWSNGMTRNPWNPEQGSSGSSAGSASATSAGLVGFAIGTETYGSIVSPATRCGVTGLRPTFGRVSRHGAMALSWSMDKIGPICRSVDDCALVFDAIYGPDGQDATVVDLPFNYDATAELAGLRIGVVQSAFDEAHDTKAYDDQTLEALRSLGVTLIPIELPAYPIEALGFILMAEAAAAFDDLTRDNRDDLMVRQEKDAWPNVLRQARLVPAVEYLQANRVRTLVMQAMARLMEDVDVYVAPSYGANNLLLCNLTGHSAVVVPNGFTPEGAPVSITFTGGLYNEAAALLVAKRYQDATDFHLRRPPMDLR